MTKNLDKFKGSFMALAMGDAYGAVFEGGFLEKSVWKLIGKSNDKLRYTDDTQMAIDIAESFIENKTINQDKLALKFANSYNWNRGYGGGAAWLLKKIKAGGDWRVLNTAKFESGSFGNGAAMRVGIIALCFSDNLDLLLENIKKVSEITHVNPLAIEGAKLVGISVYGALHNWENSKILEKLLIISNLDIYREKINLCIKYINKIDGVNNKIIKKTLGNGVAAANSTVTALYFALKYRNEDIFVMFEEIFKLGGDTDTIGAMAGSIWGAFNGVSKLDKDKLNRVEDSEKILAIAEKIYEIQNP